MKRALRPDAAPAADDAMCDRIVGAAFKAFMEKGYAGTSTLEIATRAKVSKRDLYANFPNKQAVLLACIQNPAPRSREMLASTLTTFGATVVREVCQPAVVAMFRLAISEAERSPAVAKVLHASRVGNRNALADLLARAQAAGILRPGRSQQMMEDFFALLWGDLLLSRLLGGAPTTKHAEIEGRAHAATATFLRLYGNPPAEGR